MVVFDIVKFSVNTAKRIMSSVVIVFSLLNSCELVRLVSIFCGLIQPHYLIALSKRTKVFLKSYFLLLGTFSCFNRKLLKQIIFSSRYNVMVCYTFGSHRLAGRRHAQFLDF